MAHVQIRIGTSEDDRRPASVVVDGVDMTEHVLAAGFAVEIPDNPQHGKAVVTMRVRADRLDMDLPQAVLDAVAVDCGPRPLTAVEPISAQALAAELARLQRTSGAV